MLTQAWPIGKLKRHLRFSVVCVVLILLFIRTIHDRLDAVIQESPVDFSTLHERGEPALSRPERPIRHFNGSHIDERYRYQRTLKAGYQGSVYLYQDTFSAPAKLVVVKTISAVARNPLPTGLLPSFETVTSTWPSELDASLSITAHGFREEAPFVPVHDYFILKDDPSDGASWAWTMVTPFASGGTLSDLARQVRSVGRTEDVDQEYRPTFYRLLEGAQTMHDQGFCHDDIKPQNVFVEDDPHRWLLGDLGNTRQFQHAFHNTRLWKRKNQWPDCKLNDIRRLIKTYLSFLRDASHDREQFDIHFVEVSTDWAAMYWSFARDPTGWFFSSPADSTNITWAGTAARNDGPLAWYSSCVDPSLRAVAVKQELLCTPLWWKLWFTP